MESEVKDVKWSQAAQEMELFAKTKPMHAVHNAPELSQLPHGKWNF